MHLAIQALSLAVKNPIVKNPNSQEADLLVIYKVWPRIWTRHYRETNPASGRVEVLNPGPPDYNTRTLNHQICPGLNANEIQIPHGKYHKVSSWLKSHQNTQFCRIWSNMKMSKNPGKYEVLIKQYLLAFNPWYKCKPLKHTASSRYFWVCLHKVLIYDCRCINFNLEMTPEYYPKCVFLLLTACALAHCAKSSKIKYRRKINISFFLADFSEW